MEFPICRFKVCACAGISYTKTDWTDNGLHVVPSQAPNGASSSQDFTAERLLQLLRGVIIQSKQSGASDTARAFIAPLDRSALNQEQSPAIQQGKQGGCISNSSLLNAGIEAAPGSRVNAQSAEEEPKHELFGLLQNLQVISWNSAPRWYSTPTEETLNSIGLAYTASNYLCAAHPQIKHS